jgi:hypothetical protein
MIRWEPSFAVVRSFVDQLERSGDLSGNLLNRVNAFIDRAERFADSGQRDAAESQLREIQGQLQGSTFAELRQALGDLADSM